MPNASSGLLWWREQDQYFTLTQEILDGWKHHGLLEPGARSVQELVGKRFSSSERYTEAVRNAIAGRYLEPLNALLVAGELEWVDSETRGPLLGYSARGWLGQYLVVIPECKLVAVRMRAPRPADYRGEPAKSQFVYEDFRTDILALAQSMKCIRRAPEPRVKVLDNLGGSNEPIAGGTSAR